MMQHKILIDTDIGDDIDDALAIVYALKAGLQLQGVTTVFRNAHKRAQIAKTLLRAYGYEDIPVCAGSDDPLIAPIEARENDRYGEDGKFIPCQYQPGMEGQAIEPAHAVDFILEMVESYPGQINLVAIGPLTNVALAVRKAPKTIAKLRGITVMGGYFTVEDAEWNIFCDPEAARIVFSAGIPLRAIGYDVTSRCKLDNALLERIKASGPSTPALLFQMLEQWFAHYDFECPTLHDPLTVGTLVSNTFVGFAERPVLVGLGSDSYGHTTIRQDALAWGTGIVQVAERVNPEAYLEDFIHRVFR